MLELQRTVGNRATREMLGAGAVPAGAGAPVQLIRPAGEAGKSGWERSRQTEESLEDLRRGTNRRREAASREHLAREIERQVPDLELFRQVREGTARSVITLLVPGGGPTGVKTMNDRLIGYELNNSVFAPRRNEVFAEAFLGLRLREGETISVVEQSYKSTTLTTNVADAARLQHLMSEGMRRVDVGMHEVLTDMMMEGRAHWITQRDEASGDDGEQYRDARARVESIEQVLADLEHTGRERFRYDLQFGMAEVEGADVEPAEQAYRAALGAKMNAAKAAVMVRSGGEKEAQEAAGGDARGHMFDERRFLEFARGADALRARIEEDGTLLAIDGFPMKIFREKEGELRPNRHVFRDVRKEKIKAQDPDQVEQLERVKKYMDHVNAFDYIKRFTHQEAAEVLPRRMLEAQAMLDALRSGAPVDPERVRRMLTRDVRGMPVAQMETASELAFYERARASSDRILLNADIIDFGLDAMMAYAKGMHDVSARELSGQELFDVSSSVSDPLVERRRDALAEIGTAYEAQRRRAKRDLQRSPYLDAERLAALAQLYREGEPLVLFGGDEITLSVDPAMRPYVPDLVGAVARASRGRVAVTRARTDLALADDEAARVAAHRRAMGQADPAASVLKSFEVTRRELKWMLGQITDREERRAAQRIVDDLGLDDLYADVDDESGDVKLRRFEGDEDVTEVDLQRRIAHAEHVLHERFGVPRR